MAVRTSSSTHQGVPTDARPVRHLCDRTDLPGDLRNRILFETVDETGIARHGLLASISGKKASTTPGAIQSANHAIEGEGRIEYLEIEEGAEPASRCSERRLARIDCSPDHLNQ